MAKKVKKTEIGFPVKGFPIKFEWQTNEWLKLFDAQVDLIKEDIARNRAEDRAIIYLSCPISNRGGGFHGTNVEIAKYYQNKLQSTLGNRFWILNPAQYQMESKEGTGLILRHAKNLGIPIELINKLPRPTGGDYMRMWTRALVEDNNDNLGLDFDGYYFLGPTNTKSFFETGGAKTISTGIEEYFSRKYNTDLDFRKRFEKDDSNWETLRKEFIRFYGLRAGANYSKGCHDEWNIVVILNLLRIKKHGIGSQIGLFFDGKQVSPGAAEQLIEPGYAIETKLP